MGDWDPGLWDPPLKPGLGLVVSGEVVIPVVVPTEVVDVVVIVPILEGFAIVVEDVLSVLRGGGAVGTYSGRRSTGLRIL